MNPSQASISFPDRKKLLLAHNGHNNYVPWLEHLKADAFLLPSRASVFSAVSQGMRRELPELAPKPPEALPNPAAYEGRTQGLLDPSTRLLPDLVGQERLR